jgi:hypothetical protein
MLGRALGGFAEAVVIAASGSESDAQVIASQDQRIAELESDRWTAFSIIELEWLTNVELPGGRPQPWGGATLPEQANAELDRRARGSR